MFGHSRTAISTSSVLRNVATTCVGCTGYRRLCWKMKIIHWNIWATSNSVFSLIQGMEQNTLSNPRTPRTPRSPVSQHLLSEELQEVQAGCRALQQYTAVLVCSSVQINNHPTRRYLLTNCHHFPFFSCRTVSGFPLQVYLHEVIRVVNGAYI
jgi:hypothetical protein